MIDSVTTALASLNFAPFTWISAFLDSYVWWAFLVVAAWMYLAYPRVRKNKLRVVAFTLALAVGALLVLYVKADYALPRPCADSAELLKLPFCPADYSFPSGHTAYAFIFAGASLGTSFFPLFFLLAIATALSRIYLGVHTITDVAGGIAIGLSCYYVVESLLKALVPKLAPESEMKKLEGKKRKVTFFELRRDAAHIVFGTSLLALAWLLGKGYAELLIILGLFFGMTMMHLRMKQKPVLLVDKLFDLLERPMVMPAKGAYTYVLGALLALTFLGSVEKAIAVIAVLAWGDGMATIVGELWKRRTPLFYNRKKTVAGTLAFVAFGGLAAFPFIGLGAFALSAVCAIVETLDLGLDDNFLVPLAGTILLLVM